VTGADPDILVFANSVVADILPRPTPLGDGSHVAVVGLHAVVG
jgi:hypothetical protein